MGLLYDEADYNVEQKLTYKILDMNPIKISSQLLSIMLDDRIDKLECFNVDIKHIYIFNFHYILCFNPKIKSLYSKF